jgi:hypothetical protein
MKKDLPFNIHPLGYNGAHNPLTPTLSSENQGGGLSDASFERKQHMRKGLDTCTYSFE